MRLRERLEELIVGWILGNHPSDLEELTFLTETDFSPEYRLVWKSTAEANNSEDIFLGLIRSGYGDITKLLKLMESHRMYTSQYIRHKILELLNVTRYNGFANCLEEIKHKYIKSGDALSFANEVLQLSSETIDKITKAQQAEAQQFLQTNDWYEKIDIKEIGYTFPNLSFLDVVKMKSGQMVAINGLIKQGKTTLALAMAFERESLGHKFSYISAEMTSDEIHEQFFSYKFDIPNSAFKEPKYLSKENRQKVRDYISQMPAKKPFVFEIHTQLTLKQVHHYIRKHSSEGIKFIVIDYYGKIYATEKQYRSREEELSYISDKLKTYALKYDVCLIVIAQLNRGAFQTVSAGNIAGSMGLLRDANLVFNIYKPSNLLELKGKSHIDLGGLKMEFNQHDIVLNLEYSRHTRGGADALLTRERSGRLTTRWENYTKALDYDYVPEMAGF